MEFEQLRAVEEERVRVLGGRSFSAFSLLDAGAERRGLEGAVLNAARRLDGDDRGVRRLARALDLDNRSPWNTVCGHCFAEASAAGLVARKGRLFPKVVFTDLPAVEALRTRHDELRAARGAYLDAEPELTGAVMADCLRTVADAPDRPRTFSQIEDALGWPHRRIASVLGGVSRMRHTEFAGRRPYRFHDEHQSSSGRWEIWMDATQARAVRAAQRDQR